MPNSKLAGKLTATGLIALLVLLQNTLFFQKQEVLVARASSSNQASGRAVFFATSGQTRAQSLADFTRLPELAVSNQTISSGQSLISASAPVFPEIKIVVLDLNFLRISVKSQSPQNIRISVIVYRYLGIGNSVSSAGVPKDSDFPLPPSPLVLKQFFGLKEALERSRISVPSLRISGYRLSFGTGILRC
ncbi:MAG: hypothetical protein AAB871_00300 [Patescibacteria group bacterium]